jgi:hypothetical protein
MQHTRRSFLTYLGVGGYAAATAQLRSSAADFPLGRQRSTPPAWLRPIGPSAADELIVPAGFTTDMVVGWGDPLGSTGPEGGAERFGFNNDFIAAFPLNALTLGDDARQLVLWVNHEYPNPLFVSGYSPADYAAGRKKTASQIRAERDSVGGSVVQVKLTDAGWKAVVPAPLNRRFTASYPEIALSGPAATRIPIAIGTLANCSGGTTPWKTVLSCEENYPDYNGNDPSDFLYRWADVPELAIDETQYGWVLEIDPFGELPPVKHTSLGRFKHENAAVTVGPSGRVVVYMGDDEVDQHLYKFVSEFPIAKTAARAEQRQVLESGTLYAADLAKGAWIPLVWNAETRERIVSSRAYADARKSDPNFQIASQAELLIHTRVAAKALGATPLDRCEDCEVHPRDGSLYVALTNNSRHGNLYGHIVRLCERDDNPEATQFQYEIFLAGGPQSGLACPDNLAFDREGNLWVVCDQSSDKMNRGALKPFGNNGLYVVPTIGPSTGDAFQFASGPNDCELTGPCFSPDGSTLFLSVQHPGELSPSLQELTSHWPDGGQARPRPCVVAVRGPFA